MNKFYIWKSILLFSFIYTIIVYINNKIIFNEIFYYSILSDKFSIKSIEEIIQFKNKYEWVTYILLPFINVIKYSIVTIIIYIGIKFFEVKLNLTECFKIVLLAELIPLISSITKSLYFYIYPPSDLEVIQNFNPLGLGSLLNNENIPKYLFYPIQQLNIFEVSYWFLLAYGIMFLGKINYKKALQIISLSYGFGLVIWCIFIVFLQLQFS